MSAELHALLESRPLERLRGDVVVCGAFEDDRPLRRGAGRLDWRFCGRLEALRTAGLFRGARGEAVLIAAGGPVQAGRALLLGLGDRRDFGPGPARRAWSDAAERGLRLGALRLAIDPLGIEGALLAAHAQACVAGLCGGLERAGALELEVRIPVPEAELRRVAAALERAAASLPSRGARLASVRWQGPAGRPAVSEAGRPPGSESPSPGPLPPAASPDSPSGHRP